MTHPITFARHLVDAADTRTETGEQAQAVATFGIWIAAINHQHCATGYLPPSVDELPSVRCRRAAVGNLIAP